MASSADWKVPMNGKPMTKTGIRHPKPEGADEAWHVELGWISGAAPRVQVLYVIDLFTRECLTAKVRSALTSRDIVQVLDDLASQRGAPNRLKVNRGQLVSHPAIAGWAADHGTQLVYPNPGNPSAKGVVERFFRSLDLNGARNAAFMVNVWNRALKERK